MSTHGGEIKGHKDGRKNGTTGYKAGKWTWEGQAWEKRDREKPARSGGTAQHDAGDGAFSAALIILFSKSKERALFSYFRILLRSNISFIKITPNLNVLIKSSSSLSRFVNISFPLVHL